MVYTRYHGMGESAESLRQDSAHRGLSARVLERARSVCTQCARREARLTRAIGHRSRRRGRRRRGGELHDDMAHALGETVAACFASSSRSQHGEEELVLPLLLNATGGRRGVFVELGALDGVRFSNTFALEKCLGWGGVLIEADPQNFRLLEQSERNVTRVHAAVCSESTSSIAMSVGRGELSGDTALMTRAHAHRWRLGPYSRRESIQLVPCKPLPTLLRAAGYDRADFLSVDVEGSEEVVLRNADLAAFAVVLVENAGEHAQRLAAILERMRSAGFALALDLRLGYRKVGGWSQVFVRRAAMRADAAPGVSSGDERGPEIIISAACRAEPACLLAANRSARAGRVASGASTRAAAAAAMAMGMAGAPVSSAGAVGLGAGAVGASRRLLASQHSGSASSSLNADALAQAMRDATTRSTEALEGDYTRHTGRRPPRLFRQWATFAEERRCALPAAAYGGLEEDIAPFRAWQSPQRVARAIRCAGDLPQVHLYRVVDGALHAPHGGGAPLRQHTANLRELIDPFVALMRGTNLTFAVNSMDEPRSLLHAPNATPPLTSPWRLGGGWTTRELIPACNADGGRIVREWLGRHGYLLAPHPHLATRERLPVISVARIRGCHADILAPSHFHGHEAGDWQPVDADGSTGGERGDAPGDRGLLWPSKRPTCFWRGTMTGGHQRPPKNAEGSWRAFHRHRVVRWATDERGTNKEARRDCTADATRARGSGGDDGGSSGSVLCDVAFSGTFNGAAAHYAAMQAREYRMAPFVNYSQMAAHKYLLDIDGNTWSRRFIPLLHTSRSLLIKVALFETYERWLLRPSKHYVSASLDGLGATLRALASDDERARTIAAAGHTFARRHLRRADMQCYWFRLLMELSALTQPPLDGEG